MIIEIFRATAGVRTAVWFYPTNDPTDAVRAELSTWFYLPDWGVEIR